MTLPSSPAAQHVAGRERPWAAFRMAVQHWEGKVSEPAASSDVTRYLTKNVTLKESDGDTQIHP